MAKYRLLVFFLTNNSCNSLLILIKTREIIKKHNSCLRDRIPFSRQSHRLVNLSLEIDVQPSISLFYDSDRISKLANEGNGSQVSGNKTRRSEGVGTSRRRIYIATRFPPRRRNVIPRRIIGAPRCKRTRMYKAGNCTVTRDGAT